MTIILFLISSLPFPLFFFFFNDTATTEIYTLSLHDALPILMTETSIPDRRAVDRGQPDRRRTPREPFVEFLDRSEEHTSELQSRLHLVCRLLLEKKKKKKKKYIQNINNKKKHTKHSTN